MNSSKIVLTFLSIIAVSSARAAERATTTAPTAAEKSTWQPLFNGKDLSGWHLVHTADLKKMRPEAIFQVHDEVIDTYQDVPAGSPVPVAFIATDEIYSWYHLKLEYRWVGKRFAPRTARPRDAGILYHASDELKVWPRCIECQIQEADVGDCYLVNGAQVEATVDPAELKSGVYHYQPKVDGGVEVVYGGPKIMRIIKSATYEQEGWNSVEVIIKGDEEAVHIVNGHENFRATKLKQLGADEKSWSPLKQGRILLQAEYSEVQYRNVLIRPLEGGPFRIPAHPQSSDASPKN